MAFKCSEIRKSIGLGIHRRCDAFALCCRPGGRVVRLRQLERKSAIAYTIVHHFIGGTKEQYEASIAAVHPSRNTLPKGQIFHAAGPYAGGWSIVAVHDSKDSWERFRDGILMPRMKQGIKGGFAAPPQEMGFEVDNLQP
jgi:hypothetical protein